MRRYRVEDSNGALVAEGSFQTFGEAKAWAAELHAYGGLTLLHRTSDGWIALRHYPADSASAGTTSTRRAHGSR